jgi:dTMP kinase
MPSEARFIVIEGTDGSGKTTAAAALAARLGQAGKKAHLTSEPSRGPVGQLLRKILSRRVDDVPEAFLDYRPGPDLPSLPFLFVADRLEHLRFEVEPRLARGEVVISDRYYHSSLAYQAIASGSHPLSEAYEAYFLPQATQGADAFEFVRLLNRAARRPDVTFILDVSPELAAERRAARRGAGEIFDEPELQSRLAAAYRDLKKFLPERIEIINGDRSVDEVVEEILSHLA